MEKFKGRNSNKIEERTEENASKMVYEDNRWNGLWGEISKLFDFSLQCIFPDLDKKRLEPFIRPNDEDEYGEFKCQNVLTMWPELRKGKYPGIKVPRDVGKKIKEKLSESDMIMDLSLYEKDMLAPTCDVGFVTFSLSRKWINKSIHKMLKDGIDSWAPDLDLKVVVFAVPIMEEKIFMDVLRREAIIDTLSRMLIYSKVLPNFGDNLHSSACVGSFHRRQEGKRVLNKWFSNEQKEDEVIMRKLSCIPAEEDAYKYFKQPLRLAKTDFENAYFDLEIMWQEHSVPRTDWVVFIAPVRQQEYIDMCFLVAKLEKRIRSGNEPPMTSYAGYRPCTSELEENILKKAHTRCEVVAKSEAAKLLGYTAEAVFDCAFTYMLLKNHRLSLWTVDIEEMLEEEGNTFVYLLNRKAEIRKITNASHDDIDELKKASELILENDEGLGVTEERSLALQILMFTEELQYSCLSVLPHVLCKYLYDLSQEFTSYYNNVCKVGSVTETSTLLLCEATAVVMEQCFDLLGLNPESLNLPSLPVPLAELLQPMTISSLKQPMEVKARDPPRTSRFELFSFRPCIVTDKKFKKGKLFGIISVSDKYGLLSDNGAEFVEPDFAHVRLFDHGWRDPRNITRNMSDTEPVYLGNPNSCHAVPFSSSIEVIMHLFVTTEEKDECFELCNTKFNISTFGFWDKGSDIECGWLDIQGVDAVTGIHYILLKDAVDTDVEVRFNRNTKSRVHGWIRAYYGGDLLYKVDPIVRHCYQTLLYETNPESSLEIGQIPLRKSMLAVPVEGSLVIKAYILDVESDEVILNGCYEFNSQREGNSKVVIYGIETGCYVELNVDWKYQAYKLDESEAGSSSFLSEMR